jgi:hypothetical protein
MFSVEEKGGGANIFARGEYMTDALSVRAGNMTDTLSAGREFMTDSLSAIFSHDGHSFCR